MPMNRLELLFIALFSAGLFSVACADSLSCEYDQVEEDGACVPVPTAEHSKECPEFTVEYKSIEHYLNPKLFENPQIMMDIEESLRNGELVVIRDIFSPEFAEAMHCDLDTDTHWIENERFFEDGFHYHHHNIYERENYSQFMNDTLAMFEHPDSKAFMEKLSGRDCSGPQNESAGSGSWYLPGDHSLPHTDFIYQRTVAYVWHLSKNWQPDWGGALYWCPEHAHHAMVHASFNTLSLFAVHSNTDHFVTMVTKLAQEKRLSFNGWYTSSWIPSVEDDLEEILSTEEGRWDLTSDQYETIGDLIHNLDSGLEHERREVLGELHEKATAEFFPERPYEVFEVAVED